MRLRYATLDDMPDLFEVLAGEMHPEVGTAPLDPYKTDQAIRDVLETGAAVLAVDDDDEIVGTIGLYRAQPWYSNAEFLADRWLHVDRAARDGAALGLLLAEAGAFAREAGLDFMPGITASDRIDIWIRLYRRHGFKPVAVQFMED